MTAQRREQNLQEVPISITAFSGDALARSNIRSASEYLGLAPNVSYTEDGQTGARGIGISVRGVGTMVSGENAFINTIGVYVDEFSVISVPNQVANPELPDMERIEILRGPQGAYFGRNAVGGALNLVTKRADRGVRGRGPLRRTRPTAVTTPAGTSVARSTSRSRKRSHRTWEGRLSGYGPYPQLEPWQQVVDYELWRMNAILPSRGRHCRRQPPLLVYPEASTPLAWYRPEDELTLFDLERVPRYLSTGRWLRYTSSQGQVSFNDQPFSLGLTHQRRWVQRTYLEDDEFQVTCPPDDTGLKIIHVKGLTVSDISGLTETPMNLLRFGWGTNSPRFTPADVITLLEGVWATPPFLHNGSVPNLYQMLVPPERRDPKFFVGRREFDPLHVGFVTQPADEDGEDGFWLDTAIPGNRNTGHAFAADPEQWRRHLEDPASNPLPGGVIGPLLTDEERMSIVEYPKVHRDLPETPAGYRPPQCQLWGSAP